MKQAQERVSLSQIEELEKLLLLQEKMEKVRVSFLLPKQLILLMDEVSKKKPRSKLVLRAILKELKEQRKKKLEKKKEKLARKLKKEYQSLSEALMTRKKVYQEIMNDFKNADEETARLLPPWEE